MGPTQNDRMGFEFKYQKPMPLSFQMHSTVHCQRIGYNLKCFLVMSSCATFRNTQYFCCCCCSSFGFGYVSWFDEMSTLLCACYGAPQCMWHESVPRECECELISFVLDILSGTSNRNGQQTFKFN